MRKIQPPVVCVYYGYAKSDIIERLSKQTFAVVARAVAVAYGLIKRNKHARRQRA